jgi:small subunit ribosomal protein S19
MTRSLKKGPYVVPKLLDRVIKVRDGKKRDTIKSWKRSCTIVPEFVGATIAVHDGRKHVSVFITENMVGHKLGEFAPTRTFRMHSGQRKADKASEGSKPASKQSSGK